MPKRILAIATCRVSSIEQLDSNSLSRQAKSVKEAAKYLEVTITEDGIWSGSVSSKEGRNYSRKDLREMLEYCKKNPNVKYLIVDEIDRFMRSIDEMFYFEVEFRNKVGVKVWYAGDPALNSDDPLTKLRRAMEAFKAEGSNLERQIKSVKGQTDAILEGRWPFSPKLGYKRGYERGIQEIHDIRGPALQKTLVKIASGIVTPSQALVELNKSEFMSDGHALYKMDKFRKIVTDPFYAGILVIDKQVKVINENGIHAPLISKDQHYALIQIMNGKAKNQNGPRKNGNPDYPLSNHVTCKLCQDQKSPRYVGFKHSNGKGKRFYHKYRCRSCKRYLSREELHKEVKKQFKPLTREGIDDLIKALNVVWREKEGQATQDSIRIKHKMKSLGISVSNQVEAATDPSNAAIKHEILASIARKKEEIADLEDELTKTGSNADADKERFLKFAFGFIEEMGTKFFEIDPDNRLRCKQILFPAGFYLDANNNVYTPEISPLYGLATTKKSAEALNNSHLVRLRDSLSNPGAPLLRLLEALQEPAVVELSQVAAVVVDPMVVTTARENKLLSPTEVAALVEAYRQGESVRSLARRFGAHRHTLDRHLERAGVVKRPVVKMTADVVERASKLYAEGWSTQRLGRELGVSSSTVYKALKRAGVRMRPPIA